jgi:hypothetical protein
MKNQILGKERAIEFLMSKGIDVRKYMSPMFGFDIVKFDEDLGTPDGISCAEFIEQKHGKEVVEIIRELL